MGSRAARLGVRARSGNKHYMLKFRAHGKQRWHTIGRHGSPWTPEQAPKEAKRLLGELATGRAPADKAQVTVADAIDGFTEAHCKHLRSGDQTAWCCASTSSADGAVGRSHRSHATLWRCSIRYGRGPDETRLHREPCAGCARPLLQVGDQRGAGPVTGEPGRRHGAASRRGAARAHIYE
jgi:hypothetical protein